MNDTPIEETGQPATAEPAAATVAPEAPVTEPASGEPPAQEAAPEAASEDASTATSALSEVAADEAAEAAPESAGEAPIEAAGEAVSEPASIEAYGRRLELILEALLLAADAPLPLEQMQKLVAAEFNLGRRDLRAALERMSGRYADTACELREVGSGWRLQVRAEYGEWVSRLWQEKPPKYSRALLETLALIVYRQPITRGEIEDVRGVAVSTNILRTLLERGWVREVGHKEVPGRPALYGTAPQFLDDFNLRSLDQLPTLPEIKDLEQLEAAMARLGQNAEAMAALRAERDAAENPVQEAGMEIEVVDALGDEPPSDAVSRDTLH